MEAGQFLGNYAPYGYRKDPCCRHHLIPDAETAPVVEKIYDLYLSGLSCKMIGERLTAQGIPTPSEMKRARGEDLGRRSSAAWSKGTIRKILQNPVYLGHMVQGKEEKISFKEKKTRELPRNQWIVVEHTHEAIIKEEIFGDVKKRMAERRLEGGKHMKKKLLAMLLAVVMVCGVSGCGKDKTDATDGQQVTAELDGEMKKEADTLQKAVEGYAADLTAEDAAAAGMYTIHNGAVVGGQENWDAFAAGKTDEIIICQFSKNDGAMLDSVKRLAGGGYLVVTDVTRDGYEYTEKEDYTRNIYECMTMLDDFSLEEGGTAYTVCVLSNEKDMNADTFRTYWNEMTMDAHQVYPLFIL